MRNLCRLVLSVFLLVAFAGVSARAQAPEGGPGPNSERKGEFRDRKEARMQELFKNLNLSEEQKKMLDENRTKHREEMGALRKSMRDLREQMHQELQKQDLDMGKINELQGKMKETQAKILDYRLEGILAVHKILTPEQYKKFSEEMKKRKDDFRKKMWDGAGKHKDGPRREQPSMPEGENPGGEY